MLRYPRSKFFNKESLLKKSEEISSFEKFWEDWGETINGIFGLLIFLAVIVAAVFLVGACNSAIAEDYDRTHDSYQQIFEPSGILNNHPLETLGPIETAGSEFHGEYFSALILASGEVDGKTTTVLYLRFKW